MNKQAVFAENKMQHRYFIGDRFFYKQVFNLATPIVIQSGVVNLVSALNNIVVGQLGVEKMTEIAISNQLLTVFNVGLVGALAGIGIFTAQFYGIRDEKGLCHTLRLKRVVAGLFTVFAIIFFLVFGAALIHGYLQYTDESAEAEIIANNALSYMRIMLFGLIPYAIGQVYETTLREIGRTVPAMLGSIISVLINLLLNYVLVLGKFGFPTLGSSGAAIATVISRIAEMMVVTIWAYLCGERFVSRSWLRLPISRRLMHNILMISTAPLLANEIVYAASNAAILQVLSTRGIAAIAASNIAISATQVVNVIIYGIGTSLGIMVGNQLGSGRFEDARTTNARLIALAIATCFLCGLILLPLSSCFPKLFNTTEEVQKMSSQMIRVIAYLLPIRGFTHLAYYTLRSGGRSILTLMFDGGYLTIVCLPVTYLFAVFTGLSAVMLFTVSLIAELSKFVLAAIWMKKGIWIRSVVSD